MGSTFTAGVAVVVTAMEFVVDDKVRGNGDGVRGDGNGVRGDGDGVRGDGNGVRGDGDGVRGDDHDVHRDTAGDVEHRWRELSDDARNGEMT
ncbi:hypothetical protein PF008_g20543 [Phytophthora fragariae]|uniref:Uncharacterized protein n=1 Tax=Phytophthora fragariae TaxID=53985 RepID=A0A6G0R0B0_9STRA|nr:hypothetical protein PF008_g20543 [Phytophthora fragariae]